MKRLGKFSGHIYEGNDINNMEECGVCITDEQASDENYIAQHHIDDLVDCVTCCGCPMARVQSK